MKSTHWDERQYPWPSRRCEHWKYDCIKNDLPLGKPNNTQPKTTMDTGVTCIDGHIIIAPEWEDRISIAQGSCVLWPHEDKDAHQFWMDHGTHSGIRLTLKKMSLKTNSFNSAKIILL